ncbi:hypothetical protein N8511_02715 [Akkermansiaceae bacterium]|nr:hypothetical protein [Akkermansiaceae bacterium]
MTKFADFLNGYWKRVDDLGHLALILHDWERIPDRVDSDIDYVISGPTPRELVRLLNDYCCENDWSLIQIIEHEVDALYCVCFQKEEPFRFLLLDVTWDYRRKGIDLIPNELLIDDARQPPGRSFRVPAPRFEFLYRLVKAAAKKKDLGKLPELDTALKALYDDDPAGCEKAVKEVADLNEGGSYEQIRAKFTSAPYFRRIREGRRFGLRELKLYLKRILNPTGLVVEYGDWISESDARAAMEILNKGFRKTRFESQAGGRLFDLKLRIMSTLIVRPAGKGGDLSLLKKGPGADSDVTFFVKAVLKFMESRVNRRWIK